MPTDAVIVAAGASTRFGPADKLTADLLGRPAIAWSLAAFGAVRDLGCLVIVAAPGREQEFEAIARDACPRACYRVVPGGPRRRDSVEAGLRACSTRYVAIHDGARSLVTAALIEAVIAAAGGRPGAIAAIPVTDTIKEVADGVITGHPDRSRLWAAQTPQVVLRQAWLDAAAMSDNDETDDAAMLSRLGLECAVVQSTPENLKLTRPLDLEIARLILAQRQGSP
ncbi:IspD/TarI family cytidylyltransferase [Tepidiforma sp.]|uniref:IspD/TarI family cytidylyltransferase n=1 Tax=Tepidiforma sp. TaxID=2682230 RepID=UPI002ADE55A9|nr:IspD/TarI family cytidylyltransferase [Tepidiforma sp.]